MQELASSLPAKSIPRGRRPLRGYRRVHGGPAGFDFDYSAGLTEVARCGVRRAQPGVLEWDAPARFPNRPDADVFVGPVYEYWPGRSKAGHWSTPHPKENGDYRRQQHPHYRGAASELADRKVLSTRA